jgi:DNA-binding MarR family transcriptional regulator
VPKTQWLSEEEGRAWLGYISLTALLGDHLDRQLQRDAGMSHTTYHLLTRLAAEPGHKLRLTELARSLGITRSRLSHAVSKLEALGWLSRSSDPSDKRGQYASLTKAGQSAQAAAAPGHVEAVRQVVFDKLSAAQVSQLAEISETIVLGIIRGSEEGAAKGPELPWQRR